MNATLYSKTVTDLHAICIEMKKSLNLQNQSFAKKISSLEVTNKLLGTTSFYSKTPAYFLNRIKLKSLVQQQNKLKNRIKELDEVHLRIQEAVSAELADTELLALIAKLRSINGV